MAKNKQVQIGIGFDVDKSGLKELENIQNQLRDIVSWGNQAKGTDEFTKGLKEAGQTASKLYDILEKSYSANLGTINVTKFKQELDKAGISVKTMKQDLAKAGTQGNAAFASLGSALLNTNVQLKKSNSLLDEMATTMANTVKWGITSSIFNNISSSVQDAYHYVKQLDSSLNDIRIVTDKSTESMAKFAVQANNAAKNLGASTRDYTDASLIYYQQGLSDKDVAARAETTLKAANVTGQNTAEVSEQLTAVWNGYKVSAQEAELYIDKLAAVAATTASDLEELSTGMSKVASAANLMGVDIDQLNAQLATIVSVTRQAPESVGTALKTIYARMGDIEAGMDTETTLGAYTKEMEAMGFNVLDANGNLRDMGAVIEEIGAKWTTLSREQQIALSQTMAGTRQYNNLLSLFDNWDMYTEAMNTSAEAAGTLQKQQDTYMESTEAHLQKLRTTAEDVYDTLIKPEEINALLDVFTNGVDILGTFFDAFGGGVKSMAVGAAILSSVFGKQIGEGLINFQKNKYQEQSNLDVINMKKELVQQKIDKTGNETIEEKAAIVKYETEAKYAEKILKLKNGITNEDYEQLTSIQAKIGALTEEMELHKKIAEKKKEEFKERYDEEFDFNDIDGETNKLIEDLKSKKAELQELQNDDVPSGIIKEQKQEIKNLEEKLSLLQQIREENNKAELAESQKSAQETDFDVMKQNAEKAAALNNSITLVTSSLSVLATTWGAFQSLGSIWIDEDLTFGEKLVQTFGLLITSGGLLINSVGQIKDAYTGLTDVFGENIEAVQVKDKVLKMLGLTEATEVAATNKQTTANAAKIVSEVADAGATDKTEDETEELAKAEEDEARATLKQAAANKIKDTTEKGKKQANDVLKLDQKGSVVSNLRNLVQGGKDAVLPQLINYLTRIIGLVKNFAGPLAIATVSIVAVKGAVALYNSTLKDTAKSAKEAANAQDEVIQKTKEQYENVQSAKEAYEEVKKQYEENEINATQLRLKIIDICEQHNLEAEAVRAKTASYEDLLKILDDVKNINTSDLAIELNQGIEDYLKAIETDIWANQVKGSSRDTVIGLGKSIDVGTAIGPFDDLNKTLKKYNVEFNALTGQISLDSLIDVFKTDGQAFLNDLGENSSKTSAKLLEIVNSQKESIDKIQGYNDQIKQLDEDKILKESYEPYKNQGGFQSFEEYNNAANQAAKSLLAEGHAESWEEALEKARAYYTYVEDKIAQDASGSLAISGADEKDTISQGANVASEYFNENNGSLAAVDWQEMASSGYLKEEGNLEKILNSMLSVGADLGKTKEEIEADRVALEAALKLYQKENPEGDYSDFLDYSKEKQTKNAEIQMRFMDLAKSQGQGDLINYLNEEDWNEIFSLEDDSDQQLATFKALMETNLERYKENFSTTHAQDFATALTDIGNIGLFGGAEMLETSSSFTQLIENVDTLKAAFPELASAFDTLTDSGKVGTEEWNDSLKETQTVMKVLAADGLGAGSINAEALSQMGLTYEDIANTIAIAGNKIANDAELMAAAREMEAKALGLSTEAYQEYVEELTDCYKTQNKGKKVNAETQKSLKNIAIENTKTAKSLATISSSYKQWSKILQSAKKGTAEYASAMAEYRDAAEGVLGVELSESFLENKQNLELFNQAAQGSEEALQQLRLNASQDIVQHLELDDKEYEAQLLELLAQGQNELSELKVGATLDNTEFINGLNTLLEAGEITVEEANKILSSMGIEPDIKTKTVSVKSKHQMYTVVEGKLVEAENSSSSTVEIPYINPSGSIYKGSSYSPSSSNSGGGGGGGAKPKTAEKQDKFKADIDPFHEVNEQIDLLNANLDKLAKKQEKAFGKDLIDNLNEQNKALSKQNKNLQEKIKITNEEIAKNKNKLKNFEIGDKKLSKSVKYNDDGSIANYDEVLAAAEKRVNELVTKYNKEAKKKYKEGSKKDKDREELLTKLEKAKEEYSKLQELLDTHDEYLVNIEEYINEQQDNIDKIVENNIEMLTMPVDIKLEINDIKENYNNFIKDWEKLTSTQPVKLEIDTTLKNANVATENIENLTKLVKNTQAELAIIQKGEEGSTQFGKNEKLAYETLKEYTTQLQNELNKIPEYYESAAASIIDAMDAVNEAMDDRIADMEFYSDSIQHMINLNEKLYGDKKSTGQNSAYYNDLVKQSNTLVSTLKNDADYWKAQMDEMKGVNEKAYKEAKENYITATQDMQAAMETTLENIQLQLENSVKNAFITFEQALSPEGWNVDTMTSDWEMAVEESERYLNNIDKANQLKQLELKYQQAIDKSNSLSNQKELLALKQEELNVLKEQGKLTQYDIDRANKKLQLRLAEIALEEAQNNKSKMRLRRDSQGNYSYQYVADSDKIAEKQMAVDNLKAEMVNDDYKHFQNVVDQYLGDKSAFTEQYSELATNGATEAELAEFKENYISRLVSQGGEFAKAWDYLTQSTAVATGQDLSVMTKDEQLNMLKEQFGEDIFSSQALDFLNQLTNTLNKTDVETEKLVDTLFENIDAARITAEENKKEASNAAGYGKNFERMSDALKLINNEVKTFNDDSEKTITNLKAQLTGVKDVFNIIAGFLKDEKVQAGLEALKNAIGNDSTASGTETKSLNDGSLTSAGHNDNSGTPGDTSGMTDPTQEQEKIDLQGNGTIDVGDKVVIDKKGGATTYTKKSGKNEFYTSKDSKKKVIKAKKGETYVVQTAPVEGKDGNKKNATFIKLGSKKWVKSTDIKESSFDTGGYTGDWKTSEGRLAFLHKKELVLNAKDTENMLKMLDISRSMTSVMSSVSNKIKDMMYHIDKANNIKEMSNHKMRESELVGQLEQNVHIEATFPNVSQSHEIETAFNNLINVAAQRAYKTRR